MPVLHLHNPPKFDLLHKSYLLLQLETKEAYETELLELLGDGVGGKIGHLRPNLGLDLETGSVLTVYTSTGTPKIR